MNSRAAGPNSVAGSAVLDRPRLGAAGLWALPRGPRQLALSGLSPHGTAKCSWVSAWIPKYRFPPCDAKAYSAVCFSSLFTGLATGAP